MKLDELRKKLDPPETVPKGWKTSQQWAEEWGLAQASAQKMLQRAVHAGVMEKKMFRVYAGNRTGATRIWHWRETKT